MQASDIIEKVSIYLEDNFEDHAYTHWAEEDLLHYLRLSILTIALMRKEEYVSEQTIPLKEGALQRLPRACTELMDVVAQVDDEGGLLISPRHVSNQLHAISSRLECKPQKNAKYLIDSWSYDANMNKDIIRVSPPVPKGEEVYLSVTCYSPPTVDSLDSEVPIGAQYEPIVFELMLYYAYGVDIESVPSRDRSQQHLTNASQLLGVDIKTAANKFAYTRVPEARIRRNG